VPGRCPGVPAGVRGALAVRRGADPYLPQRKVVPYGPEHIAGARSVQARLGTAGPDFLGEGRLRA
ncbi:hypothetical protein ACWD4N_48335, partial [Streptomyces sp. NPDC002586]